MMRFPVLFLAASILSLAAVAETHAQEPGWYPRVIAPPEMRPVIEATPIELRPYRPLHFWGNTVRRNYYRGNPLPLPKDLVNTGTNLIGPLPQVLELPTQRRFSR